MAYVPIPYPSVLYAPNGVPIPVANAAAAAALPATYATAPTVAAPAVVPVLDPLLAVTTTIVEQIVAIQGLAIVQPVASVPLVVSLVGPTVLLL